MRKILRQIARANMLRMGIDRLNKIPVKGSKSKFAMNWRKFI